MAKPKIYVSALGQGEAIILLGFALGRVDFQPYAKKLYSLRLYLLLFTVEITWRTGIGDNPNAAPGL